MKKELQDKLVADFPRLYGECKKPENKYAIGMFGFECGDGWEPIIRQLSEKLKDTMVMALQVKEKFGGLRFYVDVATDAQYDEIHAAEAQSYVTCENCGAPGSTVNNRGWISTLCETCKVERYGEYEDAKMYPEGKPTSS